jgi:hypothetical protein
MKGDSPRTLSKTNREKHDQEKQSINNAAYLIGVMCLLGIMCFHFEQLVSLPRLSQTIGFLVTMILGGNFIKS